MVLGMGERNERDKRGGIDSAQFFSIKSFSVLAYEQSVQINGEGQTVPIIPETMQHALGFLYAKNTIEASIQAYAEELYQRAQTARFVPDIRKNTAGLSFDSSGLELLDANQRFVLLLIVEMVKAKNDVTGTTKNQVLKIGDILSFANSHCGKTDIRFVINCSLGGFIEIDPVSKGNIQLKTKKRKRRLL